MRHVFLLGLFLASTIFSFAQDKTGQQTEKAKKKSEQRIKVMVNQDGKQIKIDTTFNLPDEKMVQFKVDSLLHKLGVNEGNAGEPNIVILRGPNRMSMSRHHADGKPGEEQIELFYQKGDSNQVKNVRKVIRVRGESMETVDVTGDMEPPMPPMPPVPPHHMRGFKMTTGDPFAMDPNDKDIITYDKKDLGKGLEKITIVRKKHTTEADSKEVQVKVEVDDQKK